MSGFYILDPDQMCAASGADGDHVVTRMTLPVSVQCVTDQGVGTELVPVWVNPVVFAGLAVCVLAVWAGVSAAIRRRADRARGEVVDAELGPDVRPAPAVSPRWRCRAAHPQGRIQQ